jgi:hypothetical protein
MLPLPPITILLQQEKIPVAAGLASWIWAASPADVYQMTRLVLAVVVLGVGVGAVVNAAVAATVVAAVAMAVLD